MAELSKDVQACIEALGPVLQARGSMTQGELHDWWTKERHGELGALKGALAELLRMELIVARNVGKAKLVTLAHDSRPDRSSPVVRQAARDPEGEAHEDQVARAQRLEAAADRPFTRERLEQAKLGRTTSDHNEPAPAAAPPPVPPPAQSPAPTRAPSTHPPTPAIPNVRSGAGSHDNAGLPAPPDQVVTPPVAAPGSVPPVRARGAAAPSPAAPAHVDGPEWLSSAEVGAILGIQPLSVSTVLGRDVETEVRRQRGKGRGGPIFYHRDDIARVKAERDGRTARPGTFLPRVPKDAPAAANGGGGGGGGLLELHRAGDLPAGAIRVPGYFDPPVGVKPDRPIEPLPEAQRWAVKNLPGIKKAAHPGDLVIRLAPEPHYLLEQLLATGLYGPGTIEEVAERLLLAELRRHVDMPRIAKRARGER